MELNHHDFLRHVSERTCLKIKDQFYWKCINASILEDSKYCKKDQLHKLPKNNYGKLLVKQNAKTIEPWWCSCIETSVSQEISIKKVAK